MNMVSLSVVLLDNVQFRRQRFNPDGINGILGHLLLKEKA